MTSKNKNFWEFKSFLNKENKKEAELLLYGVIGEDGYWDEVTSKDFANQLKEVEDSETITIRVNSPGGDVFAGQAIYSMLKRCKAKTIGLVDGLAASIASLILMACDTVIMPKNAMLMIHKPWSFTAGNANDMREQADTLDRVEESMLTAYVDKTGLKEDEIRQLLADETWLTASIAKEKGFCDEIEETEVKALIINNCLQINGQKFNIEKYKNFNTSWFKNEEKGATGEGAGAKVSPDGFKKVVDTFNRKKEVKRMNLKAMCEAYGLDYDALINAGMAESQIKAMINTKMQSEFADDEQAQKNAQAKVDAGIKAEKDRVASIIKLGEEYNAKDEALRFVSENKTIEQFKDELLKVQNNREQKPVNSNFGIGLTLDEASSFSFVNLINALANPTNRAMQEAAQKEFDMCAKAAEKYGSKNKGTVIPVEALLAPMIRNSVSTSTAGDLIETKLQPQSLIEMLRNKSVIMQLARQLTGLVGNIDIPKQTAGTSGQWVGEDVAADESSPEFGLLKLRMKTVSANTYVTRTMLKQSSIDMENFIKTDIAKALALAIDKAGFYGTGSDSQPLGIVKTDGVNTVEFEGEYPTYDKFVDMETEIGADNADVDDMAYIVNARTRGNCKKTLKKDGVIGYIWEDGNRINGYKTLVTNQLENGDAILGNFSDLILGMFGGLEIIVDPFTKSTQGGVRVTAFQDIDYGTRHEESFCVAKKKATA